jgi:hypothetical protein
MDTSFLTKSAVAERPGWSVTLITRLPGEPDLRKKVCGRNHPLARYALARVEEAEASASFCDWQASLSKREAAARKSVATGRQAIRAMPISVEKIPLVTVRERAIESYNARNRDQGSFASSGDASGFLDRIAVNFIRHALTDYDVAWWDPAGKAGVRQAVAGIRTRLCAVMAQAYPALPEECARPRAERT